MLSTSKTEKQKDKEGRSQHRSPKPLQNKRFYLDLKSHVATNSLEQKLKSLGASVEWFLVKEVNYVVTDRPQWKAGSGSSVSGSTPKCGALTPLGGQCSESPATLDSPGDGPRGGVKRSKTRAEAMLERARLQPQQSTVDPLDNAARWNIPIWPLEKVLKWLDKIREKCLKPSTSKSTPSSSTTLKNPYIKLENISNKYRPHYKELSEWPTIHLNFEAGGCPFSPPKETDKKPKPQASTKESKDAEGALQPSKATVDTPRMTRKAHSRVHRGNETPVAYQNSGYCEICQVQYLDQRTHVQSERHTQFVSNNSNYLSLDHLISQGPNMDSFLKLNGTSQISHCQSENSRRSLRSIVKLHSLDLDTTPLKSSSGGKSLEEGSKMLLQQKESLEVQCNGIWSHCYDTRHGGMKSPISGNISHRVQWGIPETGGGRPQRVRRASASFCGSNTPSLQQQLSPTGSDSGHRLRSRGQLWLPSSLLGTTAEDEVLPSRTRLADPQSARTCRDLPLTRCDTKKPKEEVKTQPSRSQSVRRKRLSVEEKLIEDNKAYYKLEMKNSKLRSSGYYPIPKDIEPAVRVEVKEEKIETIVKCNGEQSHKESKAEETVTPKFLRVRKSELSLLSDEAESFMFGEPVRRESLTESSEEDEEEETTKSKTNKKSHKEILNEESNAKRSSDSKKGGGCVKLKIEKDDGYNYNMLHCDESSIESLDTCSLASSCDTNTRQKRKRRTHAEAFIHDNLDYYKFEIPGSRLRFQSILPPATTLMTRTGSTTRASRATCNGAHSKIITCSNEASNEKEKMSHSEDETNENTAGETENKGVKKQEKDDDKKKEEKDESNVAEKGDSDLSPPAESKQFSFEAVPELECWYKTFRRQDGGEEYYAYSLDTFHWKPFLLPYEMNIPELSAGGSGGGPGTPGYIRRRRNRFAHLLDKKPRKSPRCHASTLAILSSLMHRRRKDPDKTKDDSHKSESSAGNSTEDESASRDIPNTVPATSSEPDPAPISAPSDNTTGAPASNSDFKSESDPDLHEIARSIDKMFSMGSDGDEGSGSEHDGSGDETRQETRQETAVAHKNLENKSRKLGKKNSGKRGSSAKAKKVESDASKQHEILEIDPAAVVELSTELPPIIASELSEFRCRGGPKMDVVAMIEEFSNCRCMEEPTVVYKDVFGLNPSLFLGEVSCNSSECGASSTCETVNFSDGPEGRIFRVRGRKRKRKKNLTGWPAEKQKAKKKQLGKIIRVEESVSNVQETCTVVEEEATGVTICTVSKKSDKVSEAVSVDSDSLGACKEEKSETEKCRSTVSRTGSIDSSSGHDSSEYQPCVRMSKMPELSSSPYYVAGISNNRRLRSSSLSSSPTSHSVPVPRKYPSLSTDGLRRRASPRKCLPRASLQWSAWSARRRR